MFTTSPVFSSTGFNQNDVVSPPYSNSNNNYLNTFTPSVGLGPRGHHRSHYNMPPPPPPGSVAGRASTIISNTTHNNTSSQSLIAIICNRAHEVGVASCDLRRMRVTLTQFTDHASYVGTQRHVATQHPTEIIFPSTVANTPLIDGLREAFAVAVDFTAVARRYFNEVNGGHLLQQLMSNGESTILQIQERYLALASFCALVTYIEESQHVAVAPGCLWVSYRSQTQHVEVPRSAIKALELFHEVDNPAAHVTQDSTSRSVGSKPEGARKRGSDGAKQRGHHDQMSLFRFLDHTMTSMGRRFLAAQLMEPINDIASLELRLNAVEELTRSPVLLRGITKTLADLRVDVEQLVAYFSVEPKVKSVRSAAQTTANILQLRRVLYIVQQLGTEVLADVEPGKSSLLGATRDVFVHHTVSSFIQEIGLYLHSEDASAEESGMATKMPQGNVALQTARQCFAVKDGVSSVLDAARARYAATMQELVDECSRLQERFNIPTLKVQHVNPRGYCLTYDARHDSLAPNGVFLQKSSNKKRVVCTTREIASLNSTSKDLVVEVLTLTDSVVEGMVTYVRGAVHILHRVADSLSLLDFVASLAKATLSWQVPTCRPTFTRHGHINIKGAYAPLLLMSSSSSSVLPKRNDVSLPSSSPVALIYGPNHSGKTSYLQLAGQVALLAHLGCPVPASECVLPPLDRIVCRMGFEDSIEYDHSSFAAEMCDVAYILHVANHRTLVLLDELGRSTHHRDAAALSWSIAEHLACVRAPTLFVTHIEELVELSTVYPTVSVSHFSVNAAAGGLQFQHVLVPGPCSLDNYGLRLAADLDFPKSVLERARSIGQTAAMFLSHSKINTTTKKTNDTDDRTEFMSAEVMCDELVEFLETTTMDSAAKRAYLKHLQQKWRPHLDAVLASTAQPTSPLSNHEESQSGSFMPDHHRFTFTPTTTTNNDNNNNNNNNDGFVPPPLLQTATTTTTTSTGGQLQLRGAFNNNVLLPPRRTNTTTLSPLLGVHFSGYGAHHPCVPENVEPTTTPEIEQTPGT
eukprot:PhM_4_TR14173/c6_g1_i1/m.47404/K08740/MSH4; DNA mismatch repair protein MSH4